MTKVVCAFLVDLDDAADFPGNGAGAFGRPLCAYPLMAAQRSAHVRRIYALTASPPVKAAALQYDAVILDPPKTKPTFSECLLHGWRQISKELRGENALLEVLVVLLANAPAVTKDLIDSGVEALLDHPDLDSAISVTTLERWTPSQARRLTSDGLLVLLPPAPCVVSTEPAWHPTWGATILRPQGLESMDFLGQKVFALKTWGPGPIDHLWQIPGLEYWLKKHGIPDLSPRLEMQPRLKPQTTPKRR